MQIDRVAAVVTEFFESRWQRPIKIVEIRQKEAGWLVRFEVTEERDYMLRFARDEMIGVYQVELDASLEIVGYKRLGLKSRGQLEEIEARTEEG